MFGSSICGSYGHEISMSADNGVVESQLQALSAEQEEVLRGAVLWNHETSLNFL